MFGGFRQTPPFSSRLTGASVWLLLCVAACSGGQKEPKTSLALSAEDDPTEQLAAPPIETVQAPITHVERAKVDEAVAGGVGRFIQAFDMIEELDEYDRFVGWKIGKIHDRNRFEGLGIGTGDVITSINGLPLERPAHAYEALMSLKTAQSIDVEYLRGGRVMRLSLPIVGEPSQTPKAKEPASSQTSSEQKTGSQADEKKKSDD